MSDMMDVLFATPSTRPRIERPKAQTGGRKPPPPIPPLPYKPGDESDNESRRRRDLEIPGVRAYDAPSIPGLPTYQGKAARPDFADDIDRIVQAMVAAGDVVWDNDAQAYRKPHCRRFKFGGVS